MLEPLPENFHSTRDALRALACYVIAPARKARTGRIGLRSTGDGFGTPPFDDRSRVVVQGDRLIHDPAVDIAITTVRAAAEALDVELTPDPGVGHDLPPYQPDAPLDVDATSSFALGSWYAFGDTVLARLRRDLTAADHRTASEIQLWPEHFDIAFDIGPDDTNRVTLGASPGDPFQRDPYVYASPWNKDAVTADDFWNAPFGAVMTYAELLASADPVEDAARFLDEAVRRVP